MVLEKLVYVINILQTFSIIRNSLTNSRSSAESGDRRVFPRITWSEMQLGHYDFWNNNFPPSCLSAEVVFMSPPDQWTLIKTCRRQKQQASHIKARRPLRADDKEKTGRARRVWCVWPQEREKPRLYVSNYLIPNFHELNDVSTAASLCHTAPFARVATLVSHRLWMVFICL